MSKFVTLHGFGGSSSAELNFEVVGGTTQPTNPTENTLWVNTDTEITGWYFTPTQPENMVEGEVWFGTGTINTVAFNVLKNNTIMIYPQSAKQYVNGALVNVEAKNYIGGKWVDFWTGTLYKSGNEFEGVTGGWTLTSTSGTTASGITSLVKNTNSMGIAVGWPTIGGNTGIGIASTTNLIDVSNFTTLVCEYSVSASSTTGVSAVEFQFGLGNTTTSFSTSHKVSSTGSYTSRLDVSSINNPSYILFRYRLSAGNYGGGGGYISKLYLE